MPPLPHEASAGLVAARFDGLTLLLRQAQVSTIEQIENASGYAGVIHTLSGTFSPVDVVRPFYIVLHHAGGDFGLSCEEVNVMASASLGIQQLPTGMRSGTSPFTAFSRLRTGLGFMVSVEALASLLVDMEPVGNGY